MDTPEIRTALEACWYRWIERPRQTGGGFSIEGAPIMLLFDPPLDQKQFHDLIMRELDYPDCKPGKMKLWGNPIWRGAQKVHVYGVDLVSWQRIDLDWSWQRLLILLHHGTPPDVVLRIVTGMQALTGVQLWAGSKLLIGDAGAMAALNSARDAALRGG